MADAPFLDRRCDIGAIQAVLSAEIIAWTIVLSLAFCAVEARAAETAPSTALIQTLANPERPIQDLGDLTPPPNTENPAPTPVSTPTASGAQPIPELPIWAMLLLCFAGLGLARFKKGRKDRLSPGLE